MVAEAKILCGPSISVVVPVAKDFCGSEAVSIDITVSESTQICSASIQTTRVQPPAAKYTPSIRSGSHTELGCRRSNEDEHIRIDDLSSHLGFRYEWSLPSSFYAVFDGHNGSDAAAYMKDHAMRLFFEESDLPQTSDIDDTFLEELESRHCNAFLLADQALADESSVGSDCGTTALTALILGQHLLVANAGDCRAVLCRKGVAVQMSQDHRPSYLPEKIRVLELGGSIEDDYLNGVLAVTRALGDQFLKSPFGSEAPLTAKPEVQRTILTEEDEFLILGCDGIWDVMSNQEAVSLVRRELRQHDDPQRCARELVNHALRLQTSDNVTAVVVCLCSADRLVDSAPRQRPRFRCCMSEEARNKLRSLLEGN